MKTYKKEKACITKKSTDTLSGPEEGPNMNIKAKIGGTIEQRLELEKARTGMDTASIVRIALDEYLETFEYYEREGFREEKNEKNDD